MYSSLSGMYTRTNNFGDQKSFEYNFEHKNANLPCKKNIIY